MSHSYHLTATAEAHFWEALADTQSRWGDVQAEKYEMKFYEGLQHLAENHLRLRTAHREEMAEGTDFSLHLIEHRYVAYQPYGKNDIIIAGIFHESMDLPRHLQSLQAMSADEIKALKQTLRAVKEH